MRWRLLSFSGRTLTGTTIHLVLDESDVVVEQHDLSSRQLLLQVKGGVAGRNPAQPLRSVDGNLDLSAAFVREEVEPLLVVVQVDELEVEPDVERRLRRLGRP